MCEGDNGQRLERFQNWLEANGATLEKPELRKCGQHGNGVYAREAISDSEQYANIPSDLIITSDVCRKDLKDVLAADLSGRALLCAFLIHQRFVCAESFWKPYIDILPQEFHTPLHFSSQELLLLHGTPMEYAVEDRRSELRAEHKRVQEAVDSKAEEMLRVLDFENYLWAATVVSSRAFTEALLEVGRKDVPDKRKDDGEQGNAGAKASVLLPLLDMMNHRPQARITWLVDSDSGSISFVAGSNVAAGSEVANNYGAKSNEELLLGYGFCASPNPLNCYHIKLNYSQDPLFAEKRQILEAAGIDACDHYIRKHQLPRYLLPMLRVMAMTETDVYYVRKLLAEAPDNVEWLLQPLGLRIELRARFLLARLLDGKLNMLLNAQPVDLPETENARLALQYRAELEDILRSTLEKLHRDEDSLMSFAHSLLENDRHALPSYMAEGAVALPIAANDAETETGPEEQDAKRARATQPVQLFLEDVLVTLNHSLDRDPEFSQAVEQIDVDEDVLLTLFVLRCRAFPQSPWHFAVKRLESFKHPMLLLEEDPQALENYGEMMMEMGEIHDSLFPLLNEYFPEVFPIDQFSSELFLWAAGIVETCRVSLPARCVAANGAEDQDPQDIEGLCLV
ncbi:hypothetical protein H4R20_004132 [Coemansia guatemalensis]|uniref:SET domain-containing protein n=1 Tax=Coemansia guatemalensis TaxID=2761395 RepID=A0A9W8LS07_9FUNG|nr:hypothetical protein H4R20_004132 [Coemansia guatemalensis]